MLRSTNILLAYCINTYGSYIYPIMMDTSYFFV